jgi:hypothetical protein
MSRFKDWNKALVGIRIFMINNGFTVEKGNTWKESKAAKEFCVQDGFEGSFSSSYLYVSRNFKRFREYMIKNKRNGKLDR